MHTRVVLVRTPLDPNFLHLDHLVKVWLKILRSLTDRIYLKKNADQRTKNSGSDIANSDFTFKYFPCSVLFNTRRRDPLRLTTLLFFNYDRQFNYSFVEESRLRRATFRNRYIYTYISRNFPSRYFINFQRLAYPFRIATSDRAKNHRVPLRSLFEQISKGI